jgi:hypothetical protein
MKLFILLLMIELILNKLLSVVDLNRHGARTSYSFPDKSENIYGSGKMQLTINGFRQHQILGEFVNNKYIKQLNFLSLEYNQNNFEAFSSQTERTIFSATAFLTGLYPGYKIKVNYDETEDFRIDDTFPSSNNQMKIKEIPLQVITKKRDSMYHALNCKLDKKILKENDVCIEKDPIYPITTEDLKNSCNELRTFLKIKETEDPNELSDHVKLNYLSDFYTSYVYHFISKLRGRNISEETKVIVKKEKINRWYCERIHDSKKYRLSVSNFLDKIYDYFKKAVEANEKKSEDYKKMVLFFGHDTNFVNLFTNIFKTEFLKEMLNKAIEDEQIYNFLIPPFASNIFFELHFNEETANYYVQIIYNGEYLNKGIKYIDDKNIKGNMIDFKDFSKLVENIIDKDYQKLVC